MHHPNMLIRASAKFAKTFRCVRSDRRPPAPGPFLAWYADVFTARGFGRFAIFSDEHTLFTYLVPMGNRRTLAAVMEGFHSTMGQFFAHARIHDQAAVTEVEFVPRDDRRVIGCQNDLIYHARHRLEENDPPLDDAIFLQAHDAINGMPMAYLGFRMPREAMQEEVAKLRRG